MTNPTPQPQPQHMVALGRANTVRFRRAEIRRRIYDGSMSLMEAITDPASGKLPLSELLVWQKRWGTNRANKLLDGIGATEYTMCGNMTARQLDALSSINDKKR